MSFAVRAPCRELPRLDAEDVGQPLDLIRGEPALSAVAAAFGGAHSSNAALPRPTDLRFHWVTARMGALGQAEMREMIIDTWRMVVPKKVASGQTP